MSVIDTKPTIKITSAQRSKLAVERSKRIDKNDSRALTINSTLSIAEARRDIWP